MKTRSNPFLIRLALVGISITLGQTANADIFDTNGTDSGFGVADAGSYDWWTDPTWSDTTTVDDGTAITVGWQGTASVSKQAYFIGSGTAGENYTVRLGTVLGLEGTVDTYIQNLALNVLANGSGLAPGAAGNVTIGNTVDAGNLILRAANSVGAQNGGTLTINNGVNLNAQTLNFRGGLVTINGVVSGTGTSRIAFGSGAFGLSSGTLTLANTDNTYAGRTNADYITTGYTLAVTQLADGGSNSSIGTSSANIGINGGTLKFIGSTGAQSTNLGFHVASGGAFVDASGVTSADTISFSGAPTYTGTNSARAITLTGTNDGDNTMGFIYGNNGTGMNTLNKTGAGSWVLDKANTYTGATTISGGTLKVGTGGVINNANTTTGTGSISGAATLRVDGGTAKFNAASGSASGLQVGTTTAGNVVVTNNGILTITTGRMILGGSSAGTGTSSFTQDSGTTTVASNFYSGNFNASNIAISGGSFTVNGTSNISQRATTNFDISGTANVTFPTLNLGGQPGTYDVNINLNGGTLSVNTVVNTANGTTYVNFDGGTLKARQTNADFLNADFVYVKAGGATIDTNTFDVTIDNALLQFEATTGALTKTGAGTLTLSNANTYAGDTDVRTGTLVLANGGSQKFYPKADGSSNKITDSDPTVETGDGEGIVTLDGAFVIDLTNANTATEWLLVDVDNLTETYGSNFTVTDFDETPAESGIWKRTEDPNTYTFTESTGKLSLEAGSSNTYADWLTANSPATGFTTDSDNDGVSNGVENVLGTNPNVFSAGLTNVSATASSATYQHTLNPTIASDVSYSYEWSTDLVEWKASGETNTGGTTATITPSAPVSGVVTVTTAITVGPATKLFTRLKATKF